MNPINLLFTLDHRYIPQLRVVLTSLFLNNPGEKFHIYLLHDELTREQLDRISGQCREFSYAFTPITVDAAFFANAPASKQYPKEMYYRMLAPFLLPDSIDRILYLDPDILVINPLRPLWETPFDSFLFAAAAHSGKMEIVHSVNRMRLSMENDYYNSGVLLINLKAGRAEIKPDALFSYAKEHAAELLLPDQDMLNVLFGKRILPLNDELWNYDARDYKSYVLHSGGKHGLDWVMQNTSILHFCGKAKPWNPNYHYRFGLLYKHYMHLTERNFC